MTEQAESWHLDKKVPIAFIVTLAGIIVAMIWQTIYFTALSTEWKTQTDNRLEKLEVTDETRSNHEGRLIILEQKFNYIQQSLDRIEKNIERLAP